MRDSAGAVERMSIIESAHTWRDSMWLWRRSHLFLHFMGKSTWRGAESEMETRARDESYRAYFREKVGR